MKKLVLFALITVFLNSQNYVYAFYQEQETVQIEETKQLTEKEQKKLRKQQEKEEKDLRKQQEKEEKVRQKEEKKLKTQQAEEANSEVLQIQPQVEEVEVQPTQEQETKAIDNHEFYSDKTQTNTLSTNDEKKISENNQQENNVSKNNEQSSKSFPTWGWFVILGVIVLIYMAFRYKKFLYLKYNHNIFSISTIVCLLLLFGTIFFLFYQIGQNETGEMWGMSIKTFKFLLITAIVLTVGLLYYYNLKKTNWYFAIFNVAIQTIAVGAFVIIAIGWIILKILGSSSSTDSTTDTQSNVSTSSISTAVQKGDWVYVYDEKNNQIFSQYGRLQGYTSTTVSIRKNDWIYVYDIKGRQTTSYYSR